jgi:hypothetical protein
MRLVAAALAVLAGCHAPVYRAPSWDPTPRAVVSVGCLELTASLLADGLGKVPGIPLRLSFHSGCKEASRLDLGRVRVSARLSTRGWVALVPYDPHRIIRAGRLAPGDSADEPIEYDAPEGSLTAWSAACVDFGAVRPDVAPVSGAVICFDRGGHIVDPDAPEDLSSSADGGGP